MCSMAGPWYLVLLVAAALVQCVHSEVGIHQFPYYTGSVRGTVRNVSVDGSQVPVTTYWGVPYAKPPIGDRRFRPPEHLPALTPGSDGYIAVYNATVPPKACLQAVDNDTIHSAEDMSEDCLYFNLWRPHCNMPYLPIMIWIHGGSLRSGSSAYPLYNGEYLAARECVIVASVNYRLGPLGFLYVDAPDFEGNLGVRDVELAVRVIRGTSHVIGGHRHKVTVFGSGAGAYIASLYLIPSYLGVDANNVILQSGSPTMQLLYQSNTSAMASAVRLGEALDCNTVNSTQLLNCLRQVDAGLLMAAFASRIDGIQHRMVTMNDSFFLRKYPIEYLRNKELRDKAYMVGTNKDEATQSLIKILPQDFNINVIQPPVFNDTKMTTTLTTFLSLLYNATYLNYVASVVKVLYDYDNVRTTNNSSLAFLSPVTRDIAYTCPMKTLIDAFADKPNGVYAYSFDHAPDNSQVPAWVGATHGTEVQYIFRTSANGQPPQFTPRELELSAKMQRMWADFARYGTPTPANSTGPQWPRYTPETSDQMMVFTQDAQLNISKVQGNCPFWNTIPEEMTVNV